jgi:hypothetical protein
MRLKNKLFFRILFTIFCTVLFFLVIFYVPFVHYTDTYETAIMHNKITGEIIIDEEAGFNITPFWVFVSSVDMRPQRVCVTTTAKIVNCKLAKFVSKNLKELVSREGFHYYWLSNRFSFNLGYDTEYRGMVDLLRGYAFSGGNYSFIKVVDEVDESK